MEHSASKSGAMSILKHELEPSEPPQFYNLLSAPNAPVEPPVMEEYCLFFFYEAQVETLGIYEDIVEPEVAKEEVKKVQIDMHKQLQMQKLSVERVAEMNSAALFTIGGETESTYFAIKHVPFAVQPKPEMVINKFGSKLLALDKCIESAEKLSNSFKKEKEMFKEYYRSLYAIQETGCALRTFERIAHLFNTSAAGANKNKEHIVGVRITPLAISGKEHTRQDYILLSPVLSKEAQRGCARELNKVKALGLKINIESYYDSSKTTTYYVKRLNINPAETDSDFVKNKQEALSAIRLFEKFKECLLEQSKLHPPILKATISKDKIMFQARLRDLYTISISMCLIEDAEKAHKYSTGNPHDKLFPDTYLIFMLKYLQSLCSSSDLIQNLLSVISKAVFKREFEHALKKMNDVSISPAVKFKTKFTQNSWNDPLIGLIGVHDVFVVGAYYARNEQVIPTFPVTMVRVDGMEAVYAKGHLEDNNNAVLKVWKPIESIQGLMNEFKRIRDELYAKFK